MKYLTYLPADLECNSISGHAHSTVSSIHIALQLRIFHYLKMVYFNVRQCYCNEHLDVVFEISFVFLDLDGDAESGSSASQACTSGCPPTSLPLTSPTSRNSWCLMPSERRLPGSSLPSNMPDLLMRRTHAKTTDPGTQRTGLMRKRKRGRRWKLGREILAKIVKNKVSNLLEV